MNASSNKVCTVCKSRYEPWSTLQKACSPACALVLVDREKARKEKEARQWIRKRKAELKSRSEHVKDAHRECNAYIRERDADQPCISCGSYTAGQFHAGHYRTTKAAPELRFEELNIHKQCAQCNNFDSGNIVEYRLNLIKRIGQENVEWLEGPHKAKHYSIDDLKAIKAHFRALRRDIERERKVA